MFSAVHAKDLSRQFGRRRALSHVTLTCHSGEITGLFGPNGAGKSTLLGIFSTMVRPTSGEVHYGDRVGGKDDPELRASIGVLGHDLFLYNDLTARENLEFFAQLHGVPDRAATVAQALHEARLEERAGDRVGGFSRGLRQRLALERALLHRPRLLLLDEPFTGLDDTSARLLVNRLRAFREAGAIIILSTHDFDTADGLVDRAFCLDRGRAKEMAPGGGSLRERYRTATAGMS